MKFKKLNNKYLIRLFKGEKVLESLQDFCSQNDIQTGFINAIGAVSSATVGFYSLEKKEYSWKDFSSELEVTSLIGNIALLEEKVFIHGHINLSDHDFNVFGGHLKEAVVGATLEVMLIADEEAIKREFDEEIGLNLLDL